MEDWTNREVRQRFYQSEEWKNLRNYVLANEPFCRKCKVEGYLVPAYCADHIIDIIDQPELRLSVDNLQPLCKKCHSRKTGKTYGNTHMINKIEKLSLVRLWKFEK